MIQNQPIIIEASVLLVSLVIIIVVELTSVTRSIEIDDIRKNSNGTPEGIPPILHLGKWGRFPFLHFFILMLLSSTYFIIRNAVASTPIEIAQAPLGTFLLFLPLFEVEEYDSILQKLKFGDWNSLFVHLITVAAITFVPEVNWDKSLLFFIAVIVIPLLGSVLFTHTLFSEIEKSSNMKQSGTTLKERQWKYN